MITKLQKDKKYRAKILILSVIFLLLASPLASARSFMVYNTSAPAQAYFIVNGTSGNVGIGTTNPQGKVDVVADLNHFFANVNSGAGKSGGYYIGLNGLGVGSNGSWLMRGFNDDKSLQFTHNSGGSWLPSSLVLADNGNVGIGTASPIAKLDVNGVVRPTGWLDPASGSGLEMGWNGSESRIYSQNRSGGGWQPLALAGSNIQLLVGNVGIGTANPTSPFYVEHTALAAPTSFIYQNGATNNPTLNIRQSGAGGNIGTTQGLRVESQGVGSSNIADFAYWDGAISTSRMVVRHDGNVGIGTTGPNALLDVNGAAGTRGNFSVNYADGGCSYATQSGKRFSVTDSNDRIEVYQAAGNVMGIRGVRDCSSSDSADIVLNPSAGNVGIGDTDPTEGKLVVNGNIGFTGATATAARINSGSFTTNGVDNRPIAHGLGVTPKLVVWMRAAGNNYWGISIGTTEQTVVNGQTPGTVTAPDSTYWYAKANTYNSNPSGGDTTWWVAYG